MWLGVQATFQSFAIINKYKYIFFNNNKTNNTSYNTPVKLNHQSEINFKLKAVYN